jgi:hypothetical protein
MRGKLKAAHHRSGFQTVGKALSSIHKLRGEIGLIPWGKQASCCASGARHS